MRTATTGMCSNESGMESSRMFTRCRYSGSGFTPDEHPSMTRGSWVRIRSPSIRRIGLGEGRVSVSMVESREFKPHAAYTAPLHAPCPRDLHGCWHHSGRVYLHSTVRNYPAGSQHAWADAGM